MTYVVKSRFYSKIKIFHECFFSVQEKLLWLFKLYDKVTAAFVNQYFRKKLLKANKEVAHLNFVHFETLSLNFNQSGGTFKEVNFAMNRANLINYHIFYLLLIKF